MSCRGIPHRLQEAVRAEYMRENHPRLHRLLDHGSSNGVRKYLYRGMTTAMTPEIQAAIDRGDPIEPFDFDRQKAIRRMALYNDWVQTTRRRRRREHFRRAA